MYKLSVLMPVRLLVVAPKSMDIGGFVVESYYDSLNGEYRPDSVNVDRRPAGRFFDVDEIGDAAVEDSGQHHWHCARCACSNVWSESFAMNMNVGVDGTESNPAGSNYARIGHNWSIKWIVNVSILESKTVKFR